MTKDKIYDFLKEHNRPFSINDIAHSVSKDTSRAVLQKSLDKLVAEHKIIENSYGKQRVYCIKQDDNYDIANMDENLKGLDREINQTSSSLKEVCTKLQNSSELLRQLKKEPTLEEALIEKRALCEEIESSTLKLNELSKTCTPMSDGEKFKIYEAYEKYVKEYRKRKRMCNDVIGTIMEGYPKTKKQLLEDVGIETDEDVKFILNEEYLKP